MLIAFSVENFLCFRDHTTFSMVATADERHPSHLINRAGVKPHRMLRVGGIYGANGHGKTKFVDAIAFLQEFVTEGSSVGDSILVKPFRGGKRNASDPTKFSIVFSVSGTKYEYGLILNNKFIEEEWLYCTPRTKEIILFERVTSRNAATTKGFSTKFSFGASLRKGIKKDHSDVDERFLDYVGAGTRENQPFLKEAAEKNISILLKPFRWFSHKLVVVPAESHYAPLHGRARADKKFVQFLSKFARRSGLGIDSFEIEEVPFDLDSLRWLPNERKDQLLKDCKEGALVVIGGADGGSANISSNDDGDIVNLIIRTNHVDSNGNITKFDLEDESSGTKRMVNLLPMLVDLAREDRVYIVDELDRKLHPILSYKFIEAFLSAAHEGQLIFTTHNTHFLSNDLLRRDEIWFVEKDADGAASMYSLTNLKVRPDIDIQKGYINGRFGAIPFVGNLIELGWGEDYAEK